MNTRKKIARIMLQKWNDIKYRLLQIRYDGSANQLLACNIIKKILDKKNIE